MSVVTTVLPVFALIAIGYLGARTNYLSALAQKGLAEFATGVAIPALLFRTVATSGAATASPLKIWTAYFGAAALTWIIATLTTRFVLRRPAADGASIAMTAAYGNSVMLGIPLCLALYGEAAAGPMAVILAFTSPIYWTVATLHYQAATASRTEGVGTLLLGVVKDLAHNPLIVAIVGGSLYRLSGLPLPAVADRVLSLLGQAGVPCALIALGTSLVGFAIKGQGPTLATVISLKLLVMPVAAWAFATALDLPPVALGVVVLFAAMPSGANAYLFASKVQRAVNSASGAVALGTALALVTASLIVAALST